MQAQETFETKMAAQLPGTIVFCGHKKSGIKLLMRRTLEHMLDRPQSADDAEFMEVEIYMASPDPVWTSVKDGRTQDSRIKFWISGIDRPPKPSDALMKRMDSETRPESHLIVVLQDHLNFFASGLWYHLMEHSSDYNVSFLIHSNMAPMMDEQRIVDARIEDNAHVAVIAWDASPEAREKVYKTFATSFGKQEDWEKHYQKITSEPTPGANAVVIEYGGIGNVAYGVSIPRVASLKK